MRWFSILQKDRVKTTSQFKKELKEIHPNLRLLEEYVGVKVKVWFKCVGCKAEIFATPDNIKQSTGCTACAAKARGYARKKRKTNEQFLEEINALDEIRVTPLEPYVMSTQKMAVRCVECAHEWGMKPDNLLRGQGCPKCRDTKPDLTVADIKERLKKHPHVTTKTKYARITDICLFKCATCNNSWKSTPHRVSLSVHGCPECAILATGYQRKEFTIRGRTFSLQGYEPFALQWILKKKKCGLKDIVHGPGVPGSSTASARTSPIS